MKTSQQSSPIAFGRAAFKAIVSAASLLTCSASGANLVAHWTFDQTNSAIFSDSGPNGIETTLDPGSTTVGTGEGISGNAALLNWQAVPGVATRLYAVGAPLQTDSFGFSFWIQPVYLNPYDSLIGKEMCYYANANSYLRMAWQVQVGAESAGTAPIEFVVRGDTRTNLNFFGNVLSTSNVGLRVAVPQWIHIAGGYNSGSGQLSLFINGNGITNNGTAGADCSDGSPLIAGSARNGTNFVAFAAGTYMDDLQIYDAPLAGSDVSYLFSNPGKDLGTAQSLTITTFAYDPQSGDLSVSYNFVGGHDYATDVSVDLVTWVEAAGFDATCECGTIALSKSVVDSVLGPAPRSVLYVRVRQSALQNGD
jgi:hypothetical protein